MILALVALLVGVVTLFAYREWFWRIKEQVEPDQLQIVGEIPDVGGVDLRFPAGWEMDSFCSGHSRNDDADETLTVTVKLRHPQLPELFTQERNPNA